MLIGFINQKLVIPENFKEMYNQDQQSLILEHEICHFDRNDIYWNCIA
jgi:bla regulator protein BlaR1